MQHARFTGAVLREAAMTHARMANAEMAGVNLSQATIEESDLPVSFSTAAISPQPRSDRSGFVSAKMAEVKLRKDFSAKQADFYRANLAGADLTNGDFRGSRLEQADLSGALTEGMRTQGALLVDGTVGK